MRVLIAENQALPVDREAVLSALDERMDVASADLPWQWSTGNSQLPPMWLSAAGILLRTGTLPAHILPAFRRLRVIALHGVGVDQVDVEAAAAQGVWVTHVPGGNTVAVAEHALGLMLALLRRIPSADAILRQRRDWDAARFLGSELAGKTVGLLGFGQTARKLARICRSLDARVIASSRGRTSGQCENTPMVGLEQLLARSDILSLHLPLTQETRGLLNAERLASMKRGAYLVNVSRGPVLDQHALEQALVSGHLSGAALDVFETEPPDMYRPLFRLQNTVLTPHMAGSTREALAAIATSAAADIARVLNGHPPRFPVNRPLTK